jgi:hypothetical protein
MNAVRDLVAAARNNPGPHRILYAHAYDPALNKGGKVKMVDGFPDIDNVDPTLIKPYIVWAKDHSTYLLASNHGRGQSDVLYAVGLDPSMNEDYYDEVDRICGGDDFSEALDIADIEECWRLYPEATHLMLVVHDASIEIGVVTTPTAG